MELLNLGGCYDAANPYSHYDAHGPAGSNVYTARCGGGEMMTMVNERNG